MPWFGFVVLGQVDLLGELVVGASASFLSEVEHPNGVFYPNASSDTREVDSQGQLVDGD